MRELRRRLLIHSQNKLLPDGFYKCDYIESTGTQYIDTGFIPNGATTRMVLDFAVTNITETTNNIAGTRNTTSSKAFAFSTINGYWRMGYNNSSTTTTVTIDTERHIVDMNRNILSLDSEIIYTDTVASFDGYSSIYLGAINASSSGYSGYVRLYGCKLYTDDILVKDFIPCFSAEEGKFGLYDTKNNVFYSSASDIDFKGKLIVPEGYSGVEYIYSDGNAYIDTGFIPNQDSRAIIDYEYTKVPTKLGVGFGVSYNGQTKNAFVAFNTAEFYLTAEYQNQNHTLCSGVAGSRIVFEIDKNYTSVTHSGNKYSHIFNKISFTCDNTLLLLGLNGVSAPLNTQTVAKVYFSAVWDNGTLIRLFAPCINSSNIYGLYDLVNGVFYQSAGTSQFGEVPAVYDFAYTGKKQMITLNSGTYKLEVWGAQGGSYSSYSGGAGGYSYGNLTLNDTSTNLYVYVGEQPATNTNECDVVTGGFNGGGNGQNRNWDDTYTYGQGGGGGTDVRIGQDSLYARVIVAGGGGGSASRDALKTKYGGGETGGSPDSEYCGGQQSAGSGGSFGKGGSASTSGSNYKYGPGGGGGGWYGGGATTDFNDDSNVYKNFNGGGSGYVYTSLTSTYYPNGCLLNSKYYLTNAETVNGITLFTSPTGTSETGHTGHGYARITKIS